MFTISIFNKKKFTPGYVWDVAKTVAKPKQEIDKFVNFLTYFFYSVYTLDTDETQMRHRCSSD